MYQLQLKRKKLYVKTKTKSFKNKKNPSNQIKTLSVPDVIL